MVIGTVDYQKLYRLTETVTPLNEDCGVLCNKICCRPDQDNTLGMYLYPGEEVMFTKTEDWLAWELRDPFEDDFPPSWRDWVHFIRCRKPCPRLQRPLSCRLFPLAPHILKDNTLLLIYETLSLPYQCPLIKNKIPLREDFVNVVALCWQELIAEQRIHDLVVLDSRAREKKEIKPTVVSALKHPINVKSGLG